MAVIDAIFQPTLQSYSPKNVIVTVGTFLMTQWDEVSVEKDEEDWKFDVGCYNNVVRRRVRNPLATITLTLPQTSAGNAYNTLQSLLDEPLLDVNSVLPVLITDLWGGSLHAMTLGTILKKPKVMYSKDPSQRSWVFRGPLDVNVLSTRNAINSLSNLF